MTPPFFRIAQLILSQRRSLRLTQRHVAAAVGCSQAYLGQVETGRRPISRKFAERLEAFFGVRRGSYTAGVTFRRGRPPLAPETRRALRLIRRARGEAPRKFPSLGPPRYPRPDRAYGLADPLDDMTNHLGGEAVWEVEQLEKLRPADDPFWRQLQSVLYDSWTEKRLHVKVGLNGADLVAVSPASLGCGLPSVHGQKGCDTSKEAYPAFVWRCGKVSVAMFPQRCVRTDHSYLWPDNLLVAACRGRRVTGIVELNGQRYHQDPERKRWRDQELAVPILHVDADEVGCMGVISHLSAWVDQLFETKGGRGRAS